MKKCATCGKKKPLSEFYWNKSNRYQSGGFYHSHCKVCHRARTNASNKAWNATATTEQKRRRYLARHHMTPEQYDELVAAQGGTCAICIAPPRVVDHDHGCCPGIFSCGECIRGVLCPTCNQGLGLFKESAELLVQASKYIKQRTR